MHGFTAYGVAQFQPLDTSTHTMIRLLNKISIFGIWLGAPLLMAVIAHKGHDYIPNIFATVCVSSIIALTLLLLRRKFAIKDDI